jgi:hypothetical protein
LREESSLGSWRELGLPKNFVGHPVADAGEKLLHEEEGFERGAGAAGADLLEFLLTEFGRVERRGEVGPPRGGLRGEGEPDPAEEAGILKNKRVAGGAQN